MADTRPARVNIRQPSGERSTGISTSAKPVCVLDVVTSGMVMAHLLPPGCVPEREEDRGFGPGDDGGMSVRALVRRPSPRLDSGIVTHIERKPVDVARAVGQWQDYVDALNGCGWSTIEVPPADDCPDSVFVEDTMLAFGDLAIVSRPGAQARRPEIDAMPELLASLGMTVAHIREPGTVDGGDVLKVDDTVYVGSGGRTNAAGIQQMRRLLEPVGARVIAVPVTKVLHLKSAVTALPDGTIIGFEPIVDDPRIFPSFRAMPEESGAHVVVLDAESVLMAADCPQSAALVRSLGYDVVTVDITEFEKLEGCVTCLSVRLRH
jgi:dimethylargininase